MNRLKYIDEKWSVTIDGYSIPFPDLKEARHYLDYIRRWQIEGEVIGYDHAKQTLFWTIEPNKPINSNPAKGHVAPSIRRKRKYSRHHHVATAEDSSL